MVSYGLYLQIYENPSKGFANFKKYMQEGKTIDSGFEFDFIDISKGYEECLEGGARCERCFNLRLEKTASKAKEKGFDYFATTLTVSPLKNAQKINQIGLEIEKKVGVNFLPTDFKKKGGYLRSIELSKEYNLYRQNYCGCVYSKIAQQVKS